MLAPLTGALCLGKPKPFIRGTHGTKLIRPSLRFGSTTFSTLTERHIYQRKSNTSAESPALPIIIQPSSPPKKPFRFTEFEHPIFMKNYTKRIDETFDQGKGVLRLIPVFVPRRFSKAGRRLRLHPDDYYALGQNAARSRNAGFRLSFPQ